MVYVHSAPSAGWMITLVNAAELQCWIVSWIGFILDRDWPLSKPFLWTKFPGPILRVDWSMVDKH